MRNRMRAIHPGEVLRDELSFLNYSANKFAKILHVPTNRIAAILNGKRSISADTALRLAKFFGTTLICAANDCHKDALIYIVKGRL